MAPLSYLLDILQGSWDAIIVAHINRMCQEPDSKYRASEPEDVI